MEHVIYKKSDIDLYKKGKLKPTTDSTEIIIQSDVAEHKKKHSVGHVIFNIVFWTIFAFILIFQVTTMIDKFSGYNLSFFGYRASVISSSSMSVVHESNKDRLEGLHDQYQKGDIVITQDQEVYPDRGRYDGDGY